MNKKINLIIISAVLLVVAGIFIFRGINLEKPKKSPGAEEDTINEESALFDRAQKAVDSGDLIKARDIYQSIAEKFPASEKIAKAQGSLEDLNVKLLLSDIPTKDSQDYVVEKGDTLTKIAKKFGTTPDLISSSNNLKNSSIQIGKSLKINKAKFSIVVDKSQNILTLKSGQEVIKTYRVSTGKNSCTPVGTFKIINKIVDPPWYKEPGVVIPAGDPKNVLAIQRMCWVQGGLVFRSRVMVSMVRPNRNL
ncbi:MAG: LysM peptidoglycan-binding domain-containing protein [Candidatus Omnitrophica bacterium]|nr:LysM peptidoglycan-binding domain-containing protein [Candidatus Omnitrophota bacterium]